ncbi:MAG TPA: hypothetical protein VMU50_11660 [Polyangia bacterium]|nr:hypothetical protein [Polyangia bacterium]
MRTYLPIVSLGVMALGCQVTEGPDQRATQIRSGCDGGAAAAVGATPAVEVDAGGGSTPDGSADVTATPFMPPATWQEHWMDHDQLLKKVSQTDDTAIYFDADVDPSSASWIQPFVAALWTYTKQTYGAPGDGRLYAVFHAGRYDGEHDVSIFDPTHDHRNVIDLGSSDKSFWTMPQQISRIAYCIGDIVELGPLGYDTLPSISLTRDQFSYFFAYDALKAVGKSAEADAWLASLMSYSIDSPRPGTFWSRDWFYPLWLGHGGAGVSARFVRLVVQQYPKIARPTGPGETFALIMNWGEYVHFMSGAAGTDLRSIATRAFGWPESNEIEFQQAKRDFPAIKY